MGSQNQRKVIVIGGGPGGYPAAIKAARLGADVTLVDKGGLGGTCLHRGCISTKTMLKYVSDYKTMAQMLKDFGAKEIPEPSLDAMMNKKAQVVKKLTAGTQGLLQKNGVNIVKGTAAFKSPGVIRILETDEEYSASSFIIATGSKSIQLPIPGINLQGVLDSDQLLNIAKIPESLVVIGGGYIGLEFAQIFQVLGTKITVIEMLEDILPTEDPDIAKALMQIIARSGISFFTGAGVKEITGKGNMLQVTYEKDGNQHQETAEKVLMAVGRRACTEGLGLEGIGLRLNNNGTIPVNENLETKVPGIFAVGDVVGGVMLAHKASAEGETAALGATGSPCPVPYAIIPSVMYTKPEVARAGLLETAARKKYGDILVGRFPFAANGRAVLEGSAQGFVKVIASAEDECIVGVSIIGPDAGHLIGEAALAVEMEATLSDLEDTVHAHPTFSEALREAALDAKGNAIHIPPP